jgi:hypothetical protein
MLTKNLFFNWLILILFFGSCQEKRLDNFGLDSFEGEKLVVKGHLAANNYPVILLKHTIPPFSPNIENDGVTNATILLLEDGIIVDSLQELGDGYYQCLSKRLAIGKGYSFEIKASGFPSVSTLIDTIPPKVTLETNNISYNNDSSELWINFSFVDEVSSQNYYLLQFYRHYAGTWDTFMPSQDPFFRPFLDGIGNYSYPCRLAFSGNEGYLLNDICSNGQAFAFRLETPRTISELDSNYVPQLYRIDSVRIELQHLSQKRYLYEKTAGEHYASNTDPFTDVVRVYSNIIGGYGIAAGFAADTITVDLW